MEVITSSAGVAHPQNKAAWNIHETSTLSHRSLMQSAKMELDKDSRNLHTTDFTKLSRSTTFPYSQPLLQSCAAKAPKRSKPTSNLHLPSFRDLGISSAHPVYLTPNERTPDLHERPHEKSNLRKPVPVPPQTHESHCCTIRSPPTPPEDSSAKAAWLSPGRPSSKDKHAASQSENIGGGAFPTQRTFTQSSRNIELPLPAGEEIVAGFTTRASWLNEPVRVIVSSFDDTQFINSVEVISQVLPGQSKERRPKPTYEDVLTTVQEDLPSSPFITITHGVTQAMAMEEMPKTPPTTPFATDAAAHYFADNQTIFTNAAVVPVYHAALTDENESAISKPRQISAPFKSNITILERYIPPTTSQEVEDFFKPSSNRSYLADRLPELALGTGSLLLVYPTKSGAETFAKHYIGPVLDPLLRQFVILNNLTVDAAEKLGKMAAVESMFTFEEMKRKVEHLCNIMSQESHPRGRRSAFKVVYNEVAETTLDRETWINWWIDQEQPRLRQNLVEYHHAGGRMPPRLGDERYESTVGMLTRDIIGEVKKSKATAGSVGIEVGVFVIQRVST